MKCNLPVAKAVGPAAASDWVACWTGNHGCRITRIAFERLTHGKYDLSKEECDPSQPERASVPGSQVLCCGLIAGRGRGRLRVRSLGKFTFWRLGLVLRSVCRLSVPRL